MATVIDELVTILGLDVAAGVVPKIQQFNNAIEGITRYAGWASAALMAAASSIAYFTERASQASAKLDKFSQLTGINSNAVQELGFAVELVGGNMNSLQGDLMSLTKSMSSPIPGEFNHALFMMGVSAHKAGGGLKTADELLIDIAGRLEGMSAQRQIQWASRIGLSDDTILLLQMGRKEIERLRQQARDINAIVPEEHLKKARKFVEQLSLVRRVITVIGQEAASAAGPAMQGMVDTMVEWLKVNKELIQQGIGNFITGVIDGFDRFGNLLRKIRDYLTDVFPALKGFAGLMTDMSTISAIVFGALTLLAGALVFLGAKFIAIGVLIAAATAIFDDFVTYLEGGESIIGDLLKAVDKLWKGFNEKFPNIGSLVKNLGELFKTLGKIVLNNLVSGFQLAWEGLKIFGRGIEWVIDIASQLLDKFLGFVGIGKLGNAVDKLKDWADLDAETLKMWVTQAKDYNQAQVGVPTPANVTTNNPSIQTTFNINGSNAPGIAAEVNRTLDNLLQSTFPGGLTPVAQ